jgi:hypothetical protein
MGVEVETTFMKVKIKLHGPKKDLYGIIAGGPE